MAYDLELAARIRELLSERGDVVEKKMFGGLAFMVAGNMAVVASGEGGLMVRVGPNDYETILDTTPAEVITMRDRPFTGWVRIDTAQLGTDVALSEWVDRGVRFAETLPAK